MRLATGYKIGFSYSSAFECNSISGNTIKTGLLMKINLKYTRADNNNKGIGI